jgi:hypothetical protein
VRGLYNINKNLFDSFSFYTGNSLITTRLEIRSSFLFVQEYEEGYEKELLNLLKCYIFDLEAYFLSKIWLKKVYFFQLKGVGNKAKKKNLSFSFLFALSLNFLLFLEFFFFLTKNPEDVLSEKNSFVNSNVLLDEPGVFIFYLKFDKLWPKATKFNNCSISYLKVILNYDKTNLVSQNFLRLVKSRLIF